MGKQIETINDALEAIEFNFYQGEKINIGRIMMSYALGLF